MDLESECSAHKSEEDNQVDQVKVSPVDHYEIKNNGDCSNENFNSGSPENLADNKPNNVTSERCLNSPSPVSKSLVEGSSPATKGYGLKKWKRIRRDIVKDSGATVVDTGKILKRVAEIKLNPDMMRHNNEAFVGSENVVKNVGVVDGISIHGSGSDSRIAVGSVFAAGATDSENSEDRSSKSSTAASAPRGRNELSAALGHMREKGRMKGTSGKSSGNSSQKIMQGKGKAERDCSKKAKGERIKMEKENSRSSMESDSRSSNFVFVQNANASRNGKQIERPLSYDGENSDEAHAGEQQFSEEVKTGNMLEVEDLSQEDSTAGISWGVRENNQFSSDQDPLIQSILNLQSVQEALEKEIEKFGEIGKEPVSSLDDLVAGSSVPADFTDQGTEEPNPSDQLGSGKGRQSAVCSLVEQVSSLKQNVKILETKLDEASSMRVAKESRVAELEATINSIKSLKEESGSTIELQGEKYREIEDELEDLFRQRIEAEVEFLMITRATQSLKVVAGKQIKLGEEQETHAEEQAQMLSKLGEAENKAAKLNKQAHELENYLGDILDTEEVLATQKSMCKVATCLCMQLMLLVLVFWFFISQLSPHPGAVVPT
ncbi:hypothetical protein UlMin_004662 [Ulmus minor]